MQQAYVETELREVSKCDGKERKDRSDALRQTDSPAPSPAQPVRLLTCLTSVASELGDEKPGI